MGNFRAPLQHSRFLLAHVVPLEPVLQQSRFAHLDADLIHGVLEEAARFAAEVIAPTNRDGDTVGAVFTHGEVHLPPSIVEAHREFVAAGWPAIAHPEHVGGGGFPHLVGNLVKEWVTSANLGYSLGPMLTTSATLLLTEHGTDDQVRTYVPRMVTGEWSGTMNLTEPQAGSDLGAVTTRAEPAGAGTYRITGQKIFITFGEHNLSEQIVHLVLARLPDAPEGTRGLSLFIVPKYLVEDDGTLGPRNDVVAGSIEHKLGIHASPTCTMLFGSNGEGAVGELVGAEHDGMRLMFTMMNDARLGVGIQGVAIAERAHQDALDYAQQRQQGRREGGDAAIIEHPDVQRMLMTQAALIEASRALCAATAQAIDLAAAADDVDLRHRCAARADLLTPLAKAWPTDLGVDVASETIQVFGGMGYVEESGVAQHLRDARIAPIYEGTNGIQAIDLVGRKILRDGGETFESFVEELRAEITALPAALSDMQTGLQAALDEVSRVGRWIVDQGSLDDNVLAGAVPALRVIAATVAGCLIARGAAAAEGMLQQGQHDEYSVPWLQARRDVARFYVRQLLPSHVAWAPAATDGAALLATFDSHDASG